MTPAVADAAVKAAMDKAEAKRKRQTKRRADRRKKTMVRLRAIEDEQKRREDSLEGNASSSKYGQVDDDDSPPNPHPHPLIVVD